MGRTKSLAHLLWSSMAVTGACGDDGVNRLPDGPPAIDAAPDEAVPIPVAAFAPLVTGATTCGEAVPAIVNLAIENTGTADLVISAADASGGFLVMTTLPITIAPAGTSALEIRPPAAVIGTDLGGSTKTGTLTLTTNEPTPTRTAELAVLVNGANLELRDGAGQPIALEFTSDGTCPAPLAVFLHNSGNAPVEIIGQSSASGFAFGGFASGVIAPGASVQQDIRPFTTNACSGSETITYQVTGTTLCNGDGSSASLGITATFNITGTSFCFCS